MTTLRFAEKLLKAISGAKGLVEPSYVYLPGVPGGKEIAEKVGVDFFSVPIELGVRFLFQPSSSFRPRYANLTYSPTEPRRQSTSSETSPTRRRRCWRPPSRV